MANSISEVTVVPFTVKTVAQPPRMPLLFVVSPAAVAVKYGLAPTTPAPEVMFKVAPIAREKVPVKASVPLPKPAEPAVPRKVEVPPTRLRLPSEIVDAAAPRDRNSKVPPSSSIATSVEIRFERDCRPVSSHRRMELRMLIVSPEPMPEKRPWSARMTGAPMIVALPVN